VKELLKTLCALDGVSGWEDEVRGFILNRVRPLADELREDGVGNIFVFKKGRERRGDTLCLMAHMDEVGLFVNAITDDGFLRVICSGIDPRVLPGRPVRVGLNKTPGLIGIKPVHLAERDELTRAVKVSALYVDIGAADKAEAEKLCKLGDPISFVCPPLEMGGGFLRAKAIDDRVGCAVLIKLLEEEQARDCWYVFTAQEEVGLRGAHAAAFALKPDRALIIEGTTAADRPDVKPHKRVCVPGGGVVIPYMDGGAVYDRGMFTRLRGLCEKHGIPWQTKEYVSGGTDARAVQQTAEGVRVAGIAAAVRYLHSPASLVKLSDAEDMLNLARAYTADPL
jgi:endoglucanase